MLLWKSLLDQAPAQASLCRGAEQGKCPRPLVAEPGLECKSPERNNRLSPLPSVQYSCSKKSKLATSGDLAEDLPHRHSSANVPLCLPARHVPSLCLLASSPVNSTHPRSSPVFADGSDLPIGLRRPAQSSGQECLTGSSFCLRRKNTGPGEDQRIPTCTSTKLQGSPILGLPLPVRELTRAERALLPRVVAAASSGLGRLCVSRCSAQLEV